jgi:hypothetical protein
MAPITNPLTGIIKSSIPELFDYLFTTYGNITACSIAAARMKAQNQVYKHGKPLASILVNYRKFQEMSSAFGTNKSDTHIINMATRAQARASTPMAGVTLGSGERDGAEGDVGDRNFYIGKSG